MNSTVMNEDPLVRMVEMEVPSVEGGWVNLRVVAKRCVATDVYLFELARVCSGPLPQADPGAHITLLTPNGLTRRYSLCNGPNERDVYRIAIKREENGLGGSKCLVDRIQVGDTIPTSPPLNYFPLLEDAPFSLLIAGGIGITPILSMARALQTRGAAFQIVYLTQKPESAAFRDQLCAPDLAPHAIVHHNFADPSRKFDLVAALATCPAGGHVYCCGPRRLMDAVKDLTRGRPHGTVHFEDFGTSEISADHRDMPFQVKLKKSCMTLDVPCGRSILEILRDARVLVPSSCESGTCGACRTRLLSGVADHRDYVLDEDQLGSEIMICVSRAKSSTIEIDL